MGTEMNLEVAVVINIDTTYKFTWYDCSRYWKFSQKGTDT